uniref:Putative secreted protein n=1 Tax=Ixodes ricinus TaxID=34613 RepID=A0A6B0U1T5_IXORI
MLVLIFFLFLFGNPFDFFLYHDVFKHVFTLFRCVFESDVVVYVSSAYRLQPTNLVCHHGGNIFRFRVI